MSEKILYGSINYDVPITNRSAYAKLRAMFKGTSIMMTASSYLFPWGLAHQIEKGLEKINLGPDGNPLPFGQRVEYRLFKFDEEVSGDDLKRTAMDALDKLLSNAKDIVTKCVNELKYGCEPKTDKNGKPIIIDPLKTAKGSIRKAHSKLKDAERCALLFNLTGDLNAGFLAYEAYIIAKKEEIEQIAKGKSHRILTD